MDLPIYIDIDGTLTANSNMGWAEPLQHRLARVRQMIADGTLVVIWSARSGDYAREFCAKYDLQPLAALGKPAHCIDDTPTIRPGMEVCPPEVLD